MTTEVRELVEFAVDRYLMSTNAVYLSLLKLVVEFFDARGMLQAPDWATRRHPQLSKANCRRLLPKVKELLEQEHGLSVCLVNRKISKGGLIRHGQYPRQDDTHRTTEFYRRSYTLAGSNNWADGFVSFPAYSAIDHPCNAKRSQQKVESASKRLLRETNNVHALHRKHLISDVAMQASLGSVAVADTTRQIEGPNDAES